MANLNKDQRASSISIVASKIADVPDAPIIGAATNVGTSRAYNNGSATVAYTAAATGGTATSFTATSTPGGFTASGAGSPLTITGLQSATSYTFAVTGTNASATGPSSGASSSITATTVPAAPTIGTATLASGQSYTGSASISVPFTAPATGGAAISSYTVTSSSGNTGTGSSSPINVSDTVGTARTYTVTVTNANGTSTASSASNSIAAVSVPQTPTISSATRSSNTQVAIAFSGATGGESLTAVTVTSSPSVSLSYSGTSSPVTVTGAFVQGTSYTFSITITNSKGTSGTSSASSAVIPYALPVLGAWSVSTAYPRDYYGAVGAGGTPSTASVLMWGGYNDASSVYVGNGYIWNGSSWNLVNPDALIGRSGTSRISNTHVHIVGGVATYGEYSENRVIRFNGTSYSDDSRVPYTSNLSGTASVNGSLFYTGGLGAPGDGSTYNKSVNLGGTWTKGNNYPITNSAIYMGTDTKDFTKAIMMVSANANVYTFTSAAGPFTLTTSRPDGATGFNNPTGMITVIDNQTMFYTANSGSTSNTWLTDGTTYSASTALPTFLLGWQGGAIGTTLSAVKGTNHYRAVLS